MPSFPQITGTTDFASVQRDTIISVCLEELGKNETLATLVSDSGTQSVLEELLASVCPGDCSDHGVCTEGKRRLTFKQLSPCGHLPMYFCK